MYYLGRVLGVHAGGQDKREKHKIEWDVCVSYVVHTFNLSMSFVFRKPTHHQPTTRQ
jgi:hypothetical protein